MLQINNYQVATISSDKTIRVWSIPGKNVVNTYYGHTASGGGLAVLPGGLLASSGFDSTVRVWNMATKTLKTIQVAANVNSIMLSPVTNYLVVNMVNSIATYDPSTWTLVQSFNTTSGRSYVNMDVIKPSGNIMVGGGSSSYIDVYSPTGAQVYTNTFGAFSFKQLPDNVTVAIGILSNVKLYNSTGNVLDSTNYPASSGGNVLAFSVTPDLYYLISCGSDNSIVMWVWKPMNLIMAKTYTGLTDTINTGSVLTYNNYTGGNLNFKIAQWGRRFQKLSECKNRGVVKKTKY
jgi:WD40 repeat protein